MSSSEGAKPRKRRRRRWVLMIIAGALVVLTATGIGIYLLVRPEAATSTTRTVEVTSQTVQTTVGTTGTLEPKRRADLEFSSAGTVTSVKVAQGDTVSKGDVLATIDDDALQADLTAAKADLQAATDDRAELAASGDATDAQLSAADSKIAVAEGGVDKARAAVAAATLRATISGTVAAVSVAKGDTVGGGSGGSGSSSGDSGGSSSDAAVTIISPGVYVVETSVGSADIGKIQKGMQAQITPTGATEPIYGTVSEVGIMATSSSQSSGQTTSSASFGVVIDVTERHDDLYPGASASVSIIVEQRDGVLTVPTAALSSSNGKTVVSKLVDGQPVPTAVTVGQSYGNSTEITSGLVEGDQVVVTIERTGGAGQGQTGNRIGQQGQGGGFGAGGPAGTGQQQQQGNR